MEIIVLYKKENIDKIKELISTNQLVLKGNDIYFNGKRLKVTTNTKTYTLYYNEKIFQPKAALVACIILGMDVPDKAEIILASDEIVPENISFKNKKIEAYHDVSNRSYSKETCIGLRCDYRSGDFTYRQLEEKYGLNRPQISNILYKNSELQFWKDVDAVEKPLVKGEIVRKTKNQPRRELSPEHKAKLAEAMKKRHAAGVHPKIAPAVKKPKIKKEKPIVGKSNIFDIFMSEAKKVINGKS